MRKKGNLIYHICPIHLIYLLFLTFAVNFRRMFKLIFVGGLIYLLYRMVMGPYLEAPTMKEEPKIKPEEDDYVDYEEVD